MPDDTSTPSANEPAPEREPSGDRAAPDRRDAPRRPATLGRGSTRVFVVAFLLLIVGVAVGSTYYLLSTARAALDTPPAGPDSVRVDTTGVDTRRVDTTRNDTSTAAPADTAGSRR